MSAQRDRLVSEASLRNQMRVAALEQFSLRILEMAKLSMSQIKHELDHNTAMGSSHLNQALRETSEISSVIEHLYVNVDGRRGASDAKVFLGSKAELDLRSAYEKSGYDYWVSPPLEVGSGEDLIALVTKDTRNGTDRFIVAYMRPHVFTSFGQTEKLEDGELISLIGLDGITRARRTGHQYSSGEQLAGTLVMRKQSEEPNGTYVGPHSITQEPYIFSHRRLSEFGLFATSGMRRDRYLRPLQHYKIFVGAMVVAALVLSIAAVFLLNAYLRKQSIQLQTMRAANRQLNHAQLLGKMGDWKYDVHTSKLIISENLSRTYGVNQLVIDHRHLIEVLDTDNFARFSSAIEDVKRNKRLKVFELKSKIADGTHSYRRVLASPEMNENGDVIVIYGIDQSIDDEKTLRSLRSRAAAQARLQSMSALTATLAHEVNQPLTVISNFLSAARRQLRSDGRSDRQLNTYLQKANDQVLVLGEMIGAARELVSNSDKEMEIFELQDVINEAIDLLDVDPQYEVSSVMVVGSHETLSICGSRALVKQVFYNLLKNALEVLEDGKPEIIVSWAQSKSSLIEVSIEDNGPGFADGVRPFEAFSSEKPGGIGLGLALCRTIIEAQGGQIWVSNSDSRGARICFTLTQAN